MASELKVVSALRMMDSAPVVRTGGQVTTRLQALGLSDQVNAGKGQIKEDFKRDIGRDNKQQDKGDIWRRETSVGISRGTLGWTLGWTLGRTFVRHNK